MIRSWLRGMVLLACCCGAPLWLRAQNDGEAARYAAAGQQALAAEQYAAAQANFEKLAQLEPGIAEVHATLAVIYYKQRAFADALREVETARKLKPSLPKLDSLRGLTLAELGRFADALPGLDKGFQQKVDPEVRRMCGLQLLRTYTALHRDSDAVETALALDRQFPDDPEILYNTGRIYGNQAYLVMLRLHDTAAGSIWMDQAAGEAHESQKQYDLAIADFGRVLERDARRPGVHYRLGRIYLARFTAEHKPEDRDAAVREFQAELATDPGNGNAAYELATLHAEAGELTEAIQQYQQVLERYPDFEEALVGLGGAESRARHPELAVAPLERATKLQPDDEVAWYRLAQAQRDAGNKEGQRQALAVFGKLHNAGGRTAGKPKGVDELTRQQIGVEAQP